MRVWIPARRLALFAFVLASAACDSSTGNEGSFSIGLAETSASVSQGGTRAVTITVTRVEFDKPVTFTADGLPTGVTATFSPNASSSASVVMLLSVAGTAPPATAALTVRASGEGVTDQTAAFSLTITVTGSFTLLPHEAAVTVAQGGGGNASVLVNRIGGFIGTVDFTLSGAPAGLTATLGSANTSSNAVPVTLAASGSVAPGAYTITATGTATGLPAQQTTFTVNVIAQPPTAPLTMSFCSAPAWFAYRNEGYAWQSAPASTAITIEATERLGIAFARAGGGGAKQTDVFYATRAELAVLGVADCAGTRSVSGSVAGVSAAQVVEVAMANASARPSGTSTSFNLNGLPERPMDLMATSGVSSSTSFSPDKVILRRDLNPASGATLPALDFAASEAFSPTQFNATITNLTDADSKVFVSTFWTVGGTVGLLQAGPPAAGATVVRALPADRLVAGDVHELYVDAYQGAAGVGRTIYSYYAAATDRTETVGAFLNVPLITTLTTSPYQRYRARLEAQSDYGSMVRVRFFQAPAQNDSRLVSVHLTAGYLGGAPATWDVSIPDFTGVAGFGASWMPTQGQQLQGDVYAWGGRTALLMGAMPVAGDQVRRSDREFSQQPTVRALRGVGPSAARARRQYFSR